METRLTTPTITGLEFYCHIHSANLSFLACSIRSRNDPSPKSEVDHETKLSLRIFYVWLTEWHRHLLSNLRMIGVMNSIPTGF